MGSYVAVDMPRIYTMAQMYPEPPSKERQSTFFRSSRVEVPKLASSPIACSIPVQSFAKPHSHRDILGISYSGDSKAAVGPRPPPKEAPIEDRALMGDLLEGLHLCRSSDDSTLGFSSGICSEVFFRSVGCSEPCLCKPPLLQTLFLLL